MFVGWTIVAAAAPAFPQAPANGSLEGAITDSAGLALPGVTVSISGPAIVGYRAATSDVNGTYQFPTLPAGTYTLTCELLGYQPVHREGIVISPGQASSLALGLAPAALEPEPSVETAGGPPVIDTKIAAAPVTFTNNQLYDVPSATNMWAALDMTPGIQMRGYDVAGSHKGEQTEYETFGIRGQNRIVNDGVNTTEGTDRAGGYYDYYAIDEFTITGQGAGVEMSTPGAQVVATWKGGTNRFTGVIQGDFGTEDTGQRQLRRRPGRAGRDPGRAPRVLRVPRRPGRPHRQGPGLVLRGLQPVLRRPARLRPGPGRSPPRSPTSTWSRASSTSA